MCLCFLLMEDRKNFLGLKGRGKLAFSETFREVIDNGKEPAQKPSPVFPSPQLHFPEPSKKKASQLALTASVCPSAWGSGHGCQAARSWHWRSKNFLSPLCSQAVSSHPIDRQQTPLTDLSSLCWIKQQVFLPERSGTSLPTHFRFH